MAITRIQHWDTRGFHPHLLKTRDSKFTWGSNDCCLYAANAIVTYTGVDIADDFRGKYTTKATAFALIKSVTGGTTVEDAAAYCATKHGLIEHKFPLMAKRGDLVVIQNGSELIAGVVHLNGRHVVSISKAGPVRLPITAIKRSWAV